MRSASTPERAEVVALTVAEAGGKVVGRTRLQKMFYLLEAAGYLDSFSYSYKHYGPFSEDLVQATAVACIRGLLEEAEHPATWGGSYSIFTSKVQLEPALDPAKSKLLDIANRANPIDLELAATAIFIAKTSDASPWEETERRKPEKADRLQFAKAVVGQLQALVVPCAFPTNL